MDYRNASISFDKVTSFDVNKAIQRSLTKAVARHGLGLYIYAGEDIPETEEEAWRRRVAQANNKEELLTVWNEFQILQNNPKFKSAFTAKKKELGL